VSFGHAAFFAIGAYACAILLTTIEMPFVFGFLGSILIAGVSAAVIGYFCVKLTEIYFAMLTLAFGQLVWAIAFKWTSVTGGDTGFIGVKIPVYLDEPVSFYYFAFFVVLISAFLLWIIVQSTFGHILVAVRENRVRAEFIGVNVRRVHHMAFILAGFFAGVAGALFTLFNHSIFVESAWWGASAQVMIMAILGGVGSFFGPIFGAAALILLDRAISEFTQYWPTVLGAILLCVLFFFPEGLVGVAKLKQKWRGK
jgi:branched-chain amino acid transport system permease protein